MELQQLQPLLESIHGCTFASLDVSTEPSPGIRKVSVGERVILFNMKRGSGYERMVKRRLEDIGKDPSSFKVGELPWGERLGNLPVIQNKGKDYLQAVLIESGEVETFIGSKKVDPKNMPWLFNKSGGNQGLPSDKRVFVKCYSLDNITAIRLMGEEVA